MTPGPANELSEGLALSQDGRVFIEGVDPGKRDRGEHRDREHQQFARLNDRLVQDDRN
jgi:hypothetical protein